MTPAVPFAELYELSPRHNTNIDSFHSCSFIFSVEILYPLPHWRGQISPSYCWNLGIDSIARN
jgi:hypothetical protein